MVRDRSSSWLDSFYSRSTPVIAGPKRMSAREKAKATAWPFKTSLSGRLERKWEAAGNGPLLQWDRCRFSGLENEYPELVKIDAYHNDGCGTESCFRSTPRIPWLFTFYRWYIGFFSISRLSNRIVFKERETSSAIFWHLQRRLEQFSNYFISYIFARGTRYFSNHVISSIIFLLHYEITS